MNLNYKRAQEVLDGYFMIGDDGVRKLMTSGNSTVDALAWTLAEIRALTTRMIQLERRSSKTGEDANI